MLSKCVSFIRRKVTRIFVERIEPMVRSRDTAEVSNLSIAITATLYRVFYFQRIFLRLRIHLGKIEAPSSVRILRRVISPTNFSILIDCRSLARGNLTPESPRASANIYREKVASFAHVRALKYSSSYRAVAKLEQISVIIINFCMTRTSSHVPSNINYAIIVC